MNDIQMTKQDRNDEGIFKFLEEGLEIFEASSSFVTDMKIIIYNDERLKQHAIEYKWVSFIETIINQEIEKYSGEPNRLIDTLMPHIVSASRESPVLADLLKQEKIDILKEVNFFREFSEILNDPAKLRVNIEILSEKIEIIGDTKLREKIKKRLILIKRALDEINVLISHTEDLNNWNMYFHQNTGFFAERIKAYFKGYVDNKVQLTGLDNFNDSKLKNNVYGSTEIKKLIYLTQFTYQAESQLRYIDSLIGFLQRDIEGENWVRNTSTALFVNNIEKHATAFEKSFRNPHFSRVMLRNKSVIEEQPFKWIELLNKMRAVIEATNKSKISTIDYAKNFLVSAFANRQTELRNSVLILVSQLNQIIMSADISKDLVNHLITGLKRVKRSIKKLWDKRRERFYVIHEKIDSLHEKILPDVQRYSAIIDMSKESDSMIAALRSILEFGRRKNQVIQKLPQTKYPISNLLYADFAGARMRDNYYDYIKLEDILIKKQTARQTLDVSSIKHSFDLLTRYVYYLLSWVESIKIQISENKIPNLKQNLIKFRGEHYGR